MARGNNGLMSCFDRILQGHNHDMVVFKSDLSWTETHHRTGRRMHVKSLKYNSQLPTPRSSSSSEDAHDADAEIKFQMICIDYIKKASKQKCTAAMFFG